MISPLRARNLLPMPPVENTELYSHWKKIVIASKNPNKLAKDPEATDVRVFHVFTNNQGPLHLQTL